MTIQRIDYYAAALVPEFARARREACGALEALRAQMGLRLYRTALHSDARNITAAREIVRGCRGRSRAMTADAAARAVMAVRELRSLVREARHPREVRAFHGAASGAGVVRHYGYQTPWERTRLPLAARWWASHRRALRDGLRSALDYHPAHGDGLTIERGGTTLTVRCREEREADRYSSRCSYPIIGHCATVSLPGDGHGLRLSRADGVVCILRVREAVSAGGITATPGWMIRRGRGYSLSAAPTWLATDGEASAHGETRDLALAALRRKRAALARAAAPLTMDSVVTPAIYRRLTGACAQGTAAWLEAHGLDGRARGTVRDLLAMLEPGTYGRERLVAAVGG